MEPLKINFHQQDVFLEILNSENGDFSHLFTIKRVTQSISNNFDFAKNWIYHQIFAIQ